MGKRRRAVNDMLPEAIKSPPLEANNYPLPQAIIDPPSESINDPLSKRRRAINDPPLEAINDPLPKDVIHRIQSYLNGREAAKTTVLSQTWYKSWKHRPTIDFDERQFQLVDGFLQFVIQTLARYQDLNLNIDKFNLWMNVEDTDSSFLARYLISKALNMGVYDVDIKIQCPSDDMFSLPMSVFETTSLDTLSVSGCTIDKISMGEIMCHRLKGFRLYGVRIDDDMMAGITTSCPLMENVFLVDCKGFSKVNMSKLLHLEEVHIKTVNSRRRPLALNPLIEFNERTIGSIPSDPSIMSVYKRLSSLLLEGVQLDPDFFILFSAMFPCLVDLSICHCHGYERFVISSKSLKFINFQSGKRLKYAAFDVPSIIMFKYSGVLIPSLSFTTCSKECESNLVLSLRKKRLGVSVFHMLKNFLSCLIGSKISLVIHINGKVQRDLLGDIQRLSKPIPKPVVENFELKALPYHKEACSALWYGLLWSFSPKFVDYVQLHKSHDICAISNHEEFWVYFVKRMILHGTRTAQALSSLEGLEEIKLELLEESQSEWKPLMWKTFLDISTIPESGRKVRFQLKWK